MLLDQRRLLCALGCLFAVPELNAAEGNGLVGRFAIPASPIEIRQPAKPQRFFDTMARRAGVLGTEGIGFEAWVYPLKLLHDCRIRATIQKTGEVADMGDLVDQVTVRPESVTITATHSLFTIREIFFTPLELPGTVLLLDIDTSQPLTLTVSFVPDLKPMWPAGLGGQYASWSEERRLFIISESRRKYNGLIGSPAGLRGSATPAHELGKGAVSFDIKVDRETARRFFYPIVMAGSQTGREAAYEAYTAILRTIPREYEKLVQHYRGIREELLSVETPEPEINSALEWAKVAFDKGFISNPDLGTGLIAGWGPSGESARPGFGWFFGGDTFLNQYAISSLGAFDMMHQAFRFLRERQRADGKMMHELTQSAAWLRWFEDYPYGYYHGDTTPFYIAAFFDYFRQSGDTDLLKESWDSLKRAYSYCKSTDEDGDGLMDNTKAGLGASELGSLLEGLKTDILLGALSPAAWRAMASLSEEMGDRQIAEEARILSQKGLESANRQFWNPGMNSLIHALTESGGQNKERTAWPALGIMLGVFQDEHADATAEMMASGELSADWGVRMLANTSSAYDPAAYNNGAVWPFLTGLASAAEFARHRAFSGYQLALADARLTQIGALGYHPELLSGDYYRPLETAVPHQLFSSGGVVTSIVHGLFGLSGDAGRKTISFAPHFPPGWDLVRIRRYRIGRDLFDIDVQRGPGRLRYIIKGGNGYRLNLSAAMGLLAQVHQTTIAGIRKEGTLQQPGRPGSQDVHCLVTTEFNGCTEVQLEYDPGIELDAEIRPSQPGNSSRNLRILSTTADGNKILAQLEGLAGNTYQVRVWTSLPIAAVKGGKRLPSDPKIIEVSFPGSDDPVFIRSSLEIEIQPQQK